MDILKTEPTTSANLNQKLFFEAEDFIIQGCAMQPVDCATKANIKLLELQAAVLSFQKEVERLKEFEWKYKELCK